METTHDTGNYAGSEKASQYAASVLNPQLSLKFEGMRYDISGGAAARFFDGKTALLFDDRVHKTHEGYFNILGALDPNHGLKYRVESRSDGRTLVVRLNDETWNHRAQMSTKKNGDKRKKGRFEFLKAGISMEALAKAHELLGPYAIDFCEEVISEGHASEITPDIIASAVDYAGKMDIPVELAASYCANHFMDSNPNEIFLLNPEGMMSMPGKEDDPVERQKLLEEQLGELDIDNIDGYEAPEVMWSWR